MSVPPGAPVPSQRRWPLYAAAAGVLAVIAVLIIVFVIKPGGGGGNEQVSAQTPKFEFDLVSAKAIPGAEHTSGDPAAVAEKSAGDIRDVLDRMYSLAFLDPNNWKAGNYDSVFGFFDRGAAARRAQADGAALTLGADAGTRFSDVQPAGGTLTVSVLVDKTGSPVSASAAVQFKAKATGTSGSGELIVSNGQYFMHILEGGWTILGYSVSRHDKPLGGGPVPSGSAS